MKVENSKKTLLKKMKSFSAANLVTQKSALENYDEQENYLQLKKKEFSESIQMFPEKTVDNRTPKEVSREKCEPVQCRVLYRKTDCFTARKHKEVNLNSSDVVQRVITYHKNKAKANPPNGAMINFILNGNDLNHGGVNALPNRFDTLIGPGVNAFVAPVKPAKIAAVSMSKAGVFFVSGTKKFKNKIAFAVNKLKKKPTFGVPNRPPWTHAETNHINIVGAGNLAGVVATDDNCYHCHGHLNLLGIARQPQRPVWFPAGWRAPAAFGGWRIKHGKKAKTPYWKINTAGHVGYVREA